MVKIMEQIMVPKMATLKDPIERNKHDDLR
jgi:hypothetical protein